VDDAEFKRAMSAVFKDIEATRPGLVALDWGRRGPDWRPDSEPSVQAWLGGVGLHAPKLAKGTEALARLTNEAAAVVAEALWTAGEPTNWPPCPHHPGTHPLKAEVRGGLAVWVCPRSGDEVAAVGSLPSG
jgi:hypothetical protein